jgi:hypothetical protein
MHPDKKGIEHFMADDKVAKTSSTKYELQLSPEMVTMMKGLGISPSTKISSPEDLKVFARIGTMTQQFGTQAAVKVADGPVTNQSWCSSGHSEAN